MTEQPEETTVAELREKATEADIEGRSKMDKEELIAALEEAAPSEGSEAETQVESSPGPVYKRLENGELVAE